MNNRFCHICKSSICLCDAKVCSCAGCGMELSRNPILVSFLIQSYQHDRRVRVLRLLADRVNGRPYCHDCVPIGSNQAEVVSRFHQARACAQRFQLRSA